MAPVWVVEEGEYSDYRVVGVFSSKENAQLIADAVNAPREGGFVMPAAWQRTKPAGTVATIHLMPPSADRGDKRSVTPAGFARAVFEANHRKAQVA